MDRTVYDCLYGPVPLTEWEYTLLLSPEIQRLRGVRLSNIDSLLLTGLAGINRFEHSVGVLILAKKWLDAHPETPEKWQKIIKAAALFHDYQNTPFGHSIEYVFDDNPADTGFDRSGAAESFRGAPYQFTRLFSADERREIDALIKGQGPYGALISNDIDLDNLDNVIRAAYHMGLITAEEKNLPRILTATLRVVEGKLAGTPESVTLIKKWQAIREELYNLLLLNEADFSAKAMLTCALETALEAGTLAGSDRQAGNWRKSLTDQELLDLLSGGENAHDLCGRLARRLMRGELYHPVLIASAPNIEAYRSIASAPAKRALEAALQGEFPEGVHCIFHPILDVKKTRRSVRIKLDTGAELTLGEDSARVLIGIFTSPEAPVTREGTARIIDCLKRRHLDIGAPLTASGKEG
jgi:HD superfamily phosphohydrolase